jgi:hypothetical protein
MSDRDDETPIQVVPVEDPAVPAPKPPSERFKTYAQGLAILLPALGGLVLGILGVLKGGDAQDAGDEIWTKLRDRVNAQSKVINKLHLRVVAFQARQEGATSAGLQAKLEALQRRYDALVAQNKAKKVNGGRAKLEVLQKDLELEKLKRQRLEDKLKRKLSAAGGGAAKPAMIQQLPKSYRRKAK